MLYYLAKVNREGEYKNIMESRSAGGRGEGGRGSIYETREILSLEITLAK